MNIRRIAVVALSSRDFRSFGEKLLEAVRWIEVAVRKGAELVVLPEALNAYKGDGTGNPEAMSMMEVALDDWEKGTHLLRKAAQKYKVAVTVPVIVRHGAGLYNSFFLISKRGKTLGEYQKLRPTLDELKQGILPGKLSALEWEGLKVGGAICFDTCFPEVFKMQVDQGVRLFLIPSKWPGGSELNAWALRYSVSMAVSYSAWSRIVDITGKDLVAGGYRQETLRYGFGEPVYVASINFDRVALSDADEMMAQVFKDQNPEIRVEFDQDQCLYFVESLSPKLKIEQIMKKYQLTSTQDAFENYRQEMQRRGDFEV